VIKLEHKVEVKTNEEDEDVQFKMYVLLFFFFVSMMIFPG